MVSPWWLVMDPSRSHTDVGAFPSIQIYHSDDKLEYEVFCLVHHMSANEIKYVPPLLQVSFYLS